MCVETDMRGFGACGGFEACRGFSVKLLKPVGEHLTILIVSIDKAGVAGMPEQMPLTVGYILVE